MGLKIEGSPGAPLRTISGMPFATIRLTPFSQFSSELAQLVNHTDFYMIVFILAIVYSQVKWILSSYTAKLVAKVTKDGLALKQLENEVGLHLQSQEVRFATFQEEIVKNQDIHEQDTVNIQKDVLKRLTFLEGLFSELATSEHKLCAAAASKLRLQLETGGLWGKQLKELQELSKAADERERAWLKTAAYSPI